MTNEHRLPPSEMAREDLEGEVQRLRTELALTRSVDADALERALDSANEELRQFLHFVSHDLKAPLRHIKSFVQLLSEKHTDLDEESRLWMGFVVTGATRMDLLFDALLRYSRTSHHSLSLRMASMKEMVADVVRQSPQDLARRLTIRWGAVCDVYVDEVLMSRLIQQVLENAVAYARPEVEPVVEISVLNEDESWRIRFADNGIGVDESAHQRIFEPFQRLSPPDDQSSGIGLAICRKIARLHEGEMWVESTPATQGADFGLRLPKPPPST